ARLAHPDAPPQPLDFDPLDLLKPDCWVKVSAGIAHSKVRPELRKCLRVTKETLAGVSAAPIPPGLPTPPPINDRLWVAHYSCEPFDEARQGNRTPRVFAVALLNCLTGQPKVFAAHRVAERTGRQATHETMALHEAEVLKEVAEALADLGGAIFLHCGMN